MKKLLTVTLAIITAVSLAACGTDTSTVGTTAEATETAQSIERAEWSLTDIAALSDIARGITDREYAENVGANYVIYEDISYDHDIVCTVLFNTASVRFDTPGEYDMTYWIYFDAAALAAWADGNDVDLAIPDADRLAVSVCATVTVTEAEDTDDGDAEDDAAEADEDTASGGSGDGSTSAGAGSGLESASSGSSKSSGSGSSSKSASSGSSKSGSASCSHNWVDEGHYESVLVQAAYDEKVDTGRAQYVCNNCGYSGTDGDDVIGHTQFVCNCGYHSEILYEYVHHDAVYKTQWVSSYKCSKCGATK